MDSPGYVVGYQCIKCGKMQPIVQFRYQCEACGNNLDAVYDYNTIKKLWSTDDLSKNADCSIWRYLPLLPVNEAPDDHSIRVGGTPLVSFQKIASDYSLSNVYIKDDTRNPSGSLKDRASEVGIRHALESGMDILIAASTGNAAASLAALSAFYKKKAIILAPYSAPEAKLTQILQYGATLCLVKGTYDDAFDLSLKIAEKYGWYLRSSGTNPVLSEGKKTVALEIAEQLNWSVPDKIFVPVGDGCIIGGVYKGFYDLLQLGWIDRIPQIIAVQAKGSPAIVNALESKSDIKPVKSNTIADSISVDFPRDGLKAIRAVRESKGFGIAVSDEEILDAQKRLSSQTGIFAEPAAAAAFAGFLKAWSKEKLAIGESVVILITGTGLKDIPAARMKVEFPDAISHDLDEFQSFLDKLSSISK